MRSFIEILTSLAFALRTLVPGVYFAMTSSATESSYYASPARTLISAFNLYFF